MPDLTQFPDPAIRSGPSGDAVWEQALDWLLRLNASPADSELQQALAAWLAASEAHQRAYRKACRVWQLTGELDFAEAPVRAAPPPRRHWRQALAGGAIAACALLLALPDWATLAADHSSALGEHRQIDLDDGSRIELDSGSAVDVHFSNAERRVTLLKGRAFFQVSRDPQRPFRVQADSVQVSVTGTAFDVDLAAREVAVAVQSGTVQVRDERLPAQPPLGAGERLRIERTSPGSQRERLPVDQVAAWRDWQLLVNDRPLAEVVEELRRYQPGLILLNDPALADRRITAALNLRAPRNALQAAIEPLGGQLHSWSPYLLIISGR